MADDLQPLLLEMQKTNALTKELLAEKKLDDTPQQLLAGNIFEILNAQNLFAKEPKMYVSKSDAERYGYETYAERAEKLNGRTAMLGFVAAVISYATTGSVFFFGVFGF